MVVSEDGISPVNRLKHWIKSVIEDYSCVILPGLVTLGPALHDEKIDFVS